MELTSLNVTVRNKASKASVKNIRREGGIPAVVYGSSSEPVSIIVEASEFRKVYGSGQRNNVFGLEIDGKTVSAVVYDKQIDVISQAITHLDFKVVEADKPVVVSVPVKLNGVPYGVKTEGGAIFQDTRVIRIAALPTALPELIEVDIEEYKAGFTYYVRDLDLGEATLASSNKAVLFAISKARGGAKESDAEEEAA